MKAKPGTRFLITTPSLTPNDAISNDLASEKKVLESAGYTVGLYSEWADRSWRVPRLSKTEVQAWLSDPGVTLIYHHSTDWAVGEDLFFAHRGPIIFRYHNITPAEYFQDIAIDRRNMILARWQTKHFIESGRITSYLNASSFNSRELIDLGADAGKMHAVAPFHQIEDFKHAKIMDRIAQRLPKDSFKLLFVGRIMRHKGQFHLLQVLERFLHAYDHKIFLSIVGKPTNPNYLSEVVGYIERRGLNPHVCIHDDASFDDLHTYYQKSDAFLCMSEHEGFGIPVLEAQYHGLPVVALRSSAIPETLGPDQIVVDGLDCDRFVAALAVLRRDADARAALVQAGKANYETYRFEVLAKHFLEQSLNLTSRVLQSHL